MNEEQIRQLLTVPGSRRAAGGIILPLEGGSLYLHNTRQTDNDLTIEEQFFAAFCAKKEIIRLRQIKSSHDYLLRFRANAIVDSSRLTRVMRARRKTFESRGRVWSLSAYYDTLNGVAKKYVARLPRREQKIVRSIPFGFVPLAETNALCLRSLVGDVVMVSEALRYFYYFMTIRVHGPNYGISREDGVAAGLIGLRILNGSEAQDFDIDPRGFLSPRVDGAIRQHVDAMVEFTFGHEFAHMLLEHSPSPEAAVAPVKEADLKTYSHAQEYAADLNCVSAIGRDRDARAALARAAYNVFLYLHLVELISLEHADVPSFSVSTTHPTPLDRRRALQEELVDREEPERSELGMAIGNMHRMRDVLLQVIHDSGQGNLLTTYGSLYIRGLGGREREDRIDY